MNKILVVNDILKENDINSDVVVKNIVADDVFGISRINIEINNDTDMLIINKIDKITRLEFNINIKENCSCNFYIKISGDSGKIKYNYRLNKNSNLNIIKYNRINNINEMIEVDLKGKGATFNYLFKSICLSKESYDYAIFHNSDNTISNVTNNLANLKGCSNIQISNTIPKGTTDCVCNQYNRIINLTNNKCEIRPILYIDSDRIDANHSALIDNFEGEKMFYLETMGINKKEASRLLMTGFLLNGITLEDFRVQILDDINKYWR